MTLGEMKGRVMFQTNNDAEDLGDFMPHLDGYVNAGYDRLLYAWRKAHLGLGEGEARPLELDEDEPALPLWTHEALADFATWLVYRNGNPQKQQRGMQFLNAFLEIELRMLAEGGEKGKRDTFINIYP